MALTLNGSDPTGDLGDLLDAKLPIAGGKILQVVRATDATSRTTNSTSFTDVTGMSVTITPQKSNSALLIVFTFFVSASWNTLDNGSFDFGITDSSNNLLTGSQRLGMGTANLSGSSDRTVSFSPTLLAYATPATTSAVTYKLRFRSGTANNTVYVRNDENTAQIFAIEVSA